MRSGVVRRRSGATVLRWNYALDSQGVEPCLYPARFGDIKKSPLSFVRNHFVLCHIRYFHSSLSMKYSTEDLFCSFALRCVSRSGCLCPHTVAIPHGDCRAGRVAGESWGGPDGAGGSLRPVTGGYPGNGRRRRHRARLRPTPPRPSRACREAVPPGIVALRRPGANSVCCRGLQRPRRSNRRLRGLSTTRRQRAGPRPRRPLDGLLDVPVI